MTDEVDSAPFDINILHKHLKLCIRKEDGEIDINEYIFIFQNLQKFFSMLGTVFGFVGSDVKSKCEILHQHSHGDHCTHYETLEKMITYEKSSGIIETDKESNGCRTLLRLHRALVFVSQFLEKMNALPDDDGCTHACKDAYNQTLAKHHPWLIQKGAKLAMYSLPKKKDLINKVCDGKIEHCDVSSIITDVIQSIQVVYDKCENLYRENDLLNLP